MTGETPFKEQRGIPGKWFALPFGMVLLFSVWLVVSMAFRFQAIMNQLETTRDAWPTASKEIRQFLNDATAKLQVESNDTGSSIAPSAAYDWQSTLGRFAQSSIFDEQSQVVRDVLKVMPVNSPVRASLNEIFAKESLRSVAESEAKRSQLQSGIVGWCTVNGLRLKLPPIFIMD